MTRCIVWERVLGLHSSLEYWDLVITISESSSYYASSEQTVIQMYSHLTKIRLDHDISVRYHLPALRRSQLRGTCSSNPASWPHSQRSAIRVPRL